MFTTLSFELKPVTRECLEEYKVNIQKSILLLIT